MDILGKALAMLNQYPLCDHCLGRQFALLGYGLENSHRGEAIKLSLTMQAAAGALEKKLQDVKTLKILGLADFQRSLKQRCSTSESGSQNKILPPAFCATENFKGSIV